MSRPARSRSLAAVAIAVLAAACAPGTVAAPAPSPTVEIDPRFEAIRATRELVAEPVVELRAATLILAERLEVLRATPIAGPPDREAARLLDEPSDRLRAAATAVDELELPEGEDAANARAVLDELVAVGDELLAEIEPEVAELQALTEAEADLLALTEEWDAPGSRRMQIEHFADLTERAAAFAADLGERVPRYSCSTAWERRAALASRIAEISEEFRGYAVRYEGRTFDARREELAADPLGLEGVPLAETDATELQACWADRSPAADAEDRVDALLLELQRVLNPPTPGPAGVSEDG